MWGPRAGVEDSDTGQDMVEFRKTLHLPSSHPLLLCSQGVGGGGTQLQILGGTVLPSPLLHHPKCEPMCVHTCIFVCMCACTHSCVCLCTFMCVSVHARMCCKFKALAQLTELSRLSLALHYTPYFPTSYQRCALSS